MVVQHNFRLGEGSFSSKHLTPPTSAVFRPWVPDCPLIIWKMSASFSVSLSASISLSVSVSLFVFLSFWFSLWFYLNTQTLKTEFSAVIWCIPFFCDLSLSHRSLHIAVPEAQRSNTLPLSQLPCSAAFCTGSSWPSLWHHLAPHPHFPHSDLQVFSPFLNHTRVSSSSLGTRCSLCVRYISL